MMRTVWLIVLIASRLSLGQESVRSLEEVGRIATAMVDGDLCQKIQTPRSIQYSTVKDPRDPWRAADNYDVRAGVFIQTKKVLIRLAHLCPETCDVNLWMPMSASRGRVEIIIRNVHEISQFWNWGDLDQPMPPEMKQVFDTSKCVRVQQKVGMVSVLAPISNSSGEVVAIAEVVSQKNQDPRENVK